MFDMALNTLLSYKGSMWYHNEDSTRAIPSSDIQAK